MGRAVNAYPDRGLNFIYDLLFADDAEPFRPAAEGRLAALFDDPPDVVRLAEIAADETVEARLRVLAFRRVREAGSGEAVAMPLPLLGVIVEIGLDAGLDTLAAYADGGVRYLNQGGGMTIAEIPEMVAAPVAVLLAAGRALLPAMVESPTERQPPTLGRARLTLLVGDRRHMIEGDYAALEHDQHVGPVLHAALVLLMQLVALHEPKTSDAQGSP